MVPTKPTPMHKILGAHQLKFKVDSKTGGRVPVLMWFTELQWRHLPGLTSGGKVYPKQGFVKVDSAKYFVPPEAMNTGEAGNEKVNPPAGGTEISNLGKADPEKVENALSEIEEALRAGHNTKVTVADLHEFVKAKELSIDNYDRMPKSELIEKIVETL